RQTRIKVTWIMRFFFSSRRRHTRSDRDWSSDVCSSDLWKDTYATLHMWTQVVGKVALALAPPLNHSWAIALQITPRGLSTRPLRSEERRVGKGWRSRVGRRSC